MRLSRLSRPAILTPVELLDPKLDLIFKLLLARDEDLLRSMIAAVLQLPAPIESLEVLNPDLPGDLSPDKGVVLDVHARLSTGAQIDIEMQSRAEPAFAQRLLFYWARLYAGQLTRGQQYSELHPAYVVAWINDRLFDDATFHSVFELKERRAKRCLSDHLAIHTLEFPKLNIKDTTEPAALIRWARFFVAKNRQDYLSLAQEDPLMQRAVDKLEELSNDTETRRLAEERERGLFAYHHAMHASRKEGRDEGREEGVQVSLAGALGQFLTMNFGASEAFAEALKALDADVLEGLVPKIYGASSLNDVAELLNDLGCSVQS